MVLNGGGTTKDTKTCLRRSSDSPAWNSFYMKIQHPMLPGTLFVNRYFENRIGLILDVDQRLCYDQKLCYYEIHYVGHWGIYGGTCLAVEKEDIL